MAPAKVLHIEKKSELTGERERIQCAERTPTNPEKNIIAANVQCCAASLSISTEDYSGNPKALVRPTLVLKRH